MWTRVTLLSRVRHKHGQVLPWAIGWLVTCLQVTKLPCSPRGGISDRSRIRELSSSVSAWGLNRIFSVGRANRHTSELCCKWQRNQTRAPFSMWVGSLVGKMGGVRQERPLKFPVGFHSSPACNVFDHNCRLWFPNASDHKRVWKT